MWSVNGIIDGIFHLPDFLAEGNYTIRAYTKYLLNFEAKSLFHKKIVIDSAYSSPDYKEKSS